MLCPSLCSWVNVSLGGDLYLTLSGLSFAVLSVVSRFGELFDTLVLFLQHLFWLENGNIWGWINWHYIHTGSWSSPGQWAGLHGYCELELCSPSSGDFPISKPSSLSNHIHPQILQMELIFSQENLSHSFSWMILLSACFRKRNVLRLKPLTFFQFYKVLFLFLFSLE